MPSACEDELIFEDETEGSCKSPSAPETEEEEEECKEGGGEEDKREGEELVP